MHITLDADTDAAAGFLVQRGLMMNHEILSHLHERGTRVIRCRNGEETNGVCLVRPINEPAFQYIAWMDCLHEDAFHACLRAVPVGQWGFFRLFQPEVAHFFTRLPAERLDTLIAFTVTPDQFRPVEGDAVVEISCRDTAIFDGEMDSTRRFRYSQEGDRYFAIMRGETAVASAFLRCQLPPGADWPAVTGIYGVYVESAARRQGLGARLVSVLTADILLAGHRPYYAAHPENLASQSLARQLGYTQFASPEEYRYRYE